MPIYEYRCNACGHKLESLQRLSDAPLVTCPACGKDALAKQLSAAGFQLKGSGWYATDFKNSGSKPPAKDAAKPDAKADAPASAASTGSEAKSDTSTAAKADAPAASSGTKKGESKSETRSTSDKPAATGTTTSGGS
jgi:putative FmdB family regulatory protein